MALFYDKSNGQIFKKLDAPDASWEVVKHYTEERISKRTLKVLSKTYNFQLALLFSYKLDILFFSIPVTIN